ncbi:hypothetical protein QWJ90_01290 [Microbacterium oryzae]|uniref:hypothetical protein n=1 Tax=Microbacterium oryzae TaxID=743009 RepID=UPI0025AFB05B|nr:hypothetical protein [Microbacterium oryzae]MDN3309556.1 hypothetical protein [Microbacterium oryzae]
MTGGILEIRAGRAVIRGCPTRDRVEGIFVKPNGFQGWEGITDRRREQVARAVEHGDHDVPVYLGARVLTVDVWIIAKTVDMLRTLSQILTGVGADGGRLKVTIDHQGQELHALGRTLVAEAEDQGVRHGRYLRSSGQLQFVFADPRKYGDVKTAPETGTATSALAFQYGNFPAHPVIEIPNAPAAWSVTSPGGTLQVSGAPAGGTHRFDMRTGRLTRNGVDVTDTATVTGAIWAVPVGASWAHTLSAPGRVLTPTTFV